MARWNHFGEFDLFSASTAACKMTFTPGNGELVNERLCFATISESRFSILSKRRINRTVTYETSVNANCSACINHQPQMTETYNPPSRKINARLILRFKDIFNPEIIDIGRQRMEISRSRSISPMTNTKTLKSMQ